MSVSSELTKLQNNLSNAYSAFIERDYQVPLQKSMYNLSAAIGNTLDMLIGKYVIEVSEFPNMTVVVQFAGEDPQIKTTANYETLRFNVNHSG